MSEQSPTAKDDTVFQATSQQAAMERQDRNQALKVLGVMRGATEDTGTKAAIARAAEFSISPIGQNEEYAQLALKHFDLATRKSEIERECEKARTEFQRGVVASRDKDIDDAAKALIQGASTEAFLGSEQLSARIVRLEEENKVYSRAIQQIKGRMDEIVSERSIDANEAALPHHRIAVAKIADACAILRDALEQEAVIREAVSSAGYDVRLKVFAGYADHKQLEQQAREYVG